LLSTDGVHGTLTNAELAAHLVAPIENLEHRAKQIVDDALRKGSDDNLSCLLLRVDNLPLADIDEVHRQLTQLAIPPALEPGQRIDGLRVQRVIHNGTRSHLYLVQDEASGTHYVLKAPSPNFADDAQYLEGFIREQWVASRVQHAGVMKIFPRPEHSPFLYLLCEYIEGQTLRQWLFDNPNATLETVRNIVRDIISALRALQRTHMTHRDLKPENIMLTGTGHIKLIDFGTVHIGGFDDVASPLNDEVPVGSVDYIAPEYLLGENGAFTSDIFSLGVIVYEMLTGVLPYKLSANRQRNLRHLREYQYIPARERRRDIPQWLDLALQKATHPDARLRYQALSEFMHDLCTPNQDLVRTHQHTPLIQRNPIRFWQGTTLILLIAVIAQCSQLVGK
jgi:protein phosphatase